MLAINVVLLGGYTFGCHSLRHLIGGFRDQLSRAPACYQAYRCVTCLNQPPYALGVAESVLGRFQRSLRTPLFDGHLARLPDRLSDESKIR